MTTNDITPEPEVSVVIATYNREQSVVNLLVALSTQTLRPDTFEVIVVDDGSDPSPQERLRGLDVPYDLTVLRQDNAGPAAARHLGIERARAAIIVIVDDDMAIGADFLAQHLASHPAGTRRVVLGRVATLPDVRLRLFERFQIAVFDKLAAGIASGETRLVGPNLYTGNVSFRRDDYLKVGGFDKTLRLSEDAELGIRLEQDGVAFEFSPAAVSWHDSDHASLSGWMDRSFEYGKADAKVSQKHPVLASANPWRFLFQINPISRILVFASALAPTPMRAVSWLVMNVSLGLARLGWERAAIAGTTLVYGLQYYSGVRAHLRTRGNVFRTLAKFLNAADEGALPATGKCAKLFADIHADRRAIHVAERKYRSVTSDTGFWSDYIQKVGFQIMVSYRFMHLYETLGLRLLAKMSSRFIRHMYSADIHWETRLGPGVMVVHGIGLVLSHAARVGANCVLFHGVTLGESIHPQTRKVGAPVLEDGVHVGAGATLLGPITVGARSKVAAGCVLMTSVPPFSIVENPEPIIRVRTSAAGSAQELPALDATYAYRMGTQKKP